MDERIDNALKIAWKYGQKYGASHKTWVIDQMVRALCGSEDTYREWVKNYEIPLSDEETYKWDFGIAP